MPFQDTGPAIRARMANAQPRIAAIMAELCCGHKPCDIARTHGMTASAVSKLIPRTQKFMQENMEDTEPDAAEIKKLILQNLRQSLLGERKAYELLFAPRLVEKYTLNDLIKIADKFGSRSWAILDRLAPEKPEAGQDALEPVTESATGAAD